MGYAVEWFSPSLGTPIVSLAEYGVVFNRAAIAALNSSYAIRVGFDSEKNLLSYKASMVRNRAMTLSGLPNENATDLCA